MKTVICDIDGTLADCRHRLHHVLPHGGGGKRDWDAFFAEMGEDGVIEPVRDLVCSAAAHFRVVICTGRPEKYRHATGPTGNRLDGYRPSSAMQRVEEAA